MVASKVCSPPLQSHTRHAAARVGHQKIVCSKASKFHHSSAEFTENGGKSAFRTKLGIKWCRSGELNPGPTDYESHLSY